MTSTLPTVLISHVAYDAGAGESLAQDSRRAVVNLAQQLGAVSSLVEPALDSADSGEESCNSELFSRIDRRLHHHRLPETVASAKGRSEPA